MPRRDKGSRSHYPSDVLAGAGLGVTVALVAWKLCPPVRAEADERVESHEAHTA